MQCIYHGVTLRTLPSSISARKPSKRANYPSRSLDMSGRKMLTNATLLFQFLTFNCAAWSVHWSLASSCQIQLLGRYNQISRLASRQIHSDSYACAVLERQYFGVISVGPSERIRFKDRFNHLHWGLYSNHRALLTLTHLFFSNQTSLSCKNL